LDARVSAPTDLPGAQEARPIVAEWVDVEAGGEDTGGTVMKAYVARPAEPSAWPAVLVGFEMFGVTGYLRGIAERLAGAGYVAMVLDFDHRHPSDGRSHVELTADAEGRSRGIDLVGGLSRHEVRADVQAALDHLAGHGAGSGAAAILGLSAGGHIAYYAATQVPLAALVVFYPGWLTGTEIALSRPEPTLALSPRIAELGTPVVFLIGDDDHLFSAAQREQTVRAGRGGGAARARGLPGHAARLLLI
jgi:carboxymethylenebutenolidase